MKEQKYRLPPPASGARRDPPSPRQQEGHSISVVDGVVESLENEAEAGDDLGGVADSMVEEPSAEDVAEGMEDEPNEEGARGGAAEGMVDESDEGDAREESAEGMEDAPAAAGGMAPGMYLPEMILQERWVGQQRQYLISWQGYGETEDTWQLAADYDDDSDFADFVEEWRQDNPPLSPQKRKGSNKRGKGKSKKSR